MPSGTHRIQAGPGHSTGSRSRLALHHPSQGSGSAVRIPALEQAGFAPAAFWLPARRSPAELLPLVGPTGSCTRDSAMRKRCDPASPSAPKPPLGVAPSCRPYKRRIRLHGGGRSGRRDSHPRPRRPERRVLLGWTTPRTEGRGLAPQARKLRLFSKQRRAPGPRYLPDPGARTRTSARGRMKARSRFESPGKPPLGVAPRSCAYQARALLLSYEGRRDRPRVPSQPDPIGLTPPRGRG